MFLLLFLSQVFANLIVQNPANCLENKLSSCQVMAENNTLIELSGSRIYLAADSVIELGDKKINLYKGRIFVKGKAEVHSVYADFQCKSKDCQLDLELSQDHVKVKNLEGIAQYKKPEEESFSTYPRYFKNEIMPVSPLDGKAKESVFSVLSIKDYKDTYSLNSDLEKVLEEKESYYSTVLRDQRFISSQIIKASVVEEQEAARKRQEKRKQKLRALKKQREENRKMYFQQNFFE